jgi:hypothetical protein
VAFDRERNDCGKEDGSVDWKPCFSIKAFVSIFTGHVSGFEILIGARHERYYSLPTKLTTAFEGTFQITAEKRLTAKDAKNSRGARGEILCDLCGRSQRSCGVRVF